MSAVRFEQDGTLGHIILDAAPFNWIGDDFRVELRQAVHDASESDIRALLIRAVGPNFSCGGAVHQWRGRSPQWLRTFLTEIAQTYRTIEALRVPVVSAVRGNVFGGALELVLASDFIIAADTTLLWNLEILSGMVPVAGGVQRLVRLIGRAKAMRIAMLGEKTRVTDVPDLADYIVKDDELDQFAVDFATRLSNGPTQGYAATKAVVKAYHAGGVDAADKLLEDLILHLFRTQDNATGMGAKMPVYMAVNAPGYELPPGGFDFPEPKFTGQ